MPKTTVAATSTNNSSQQNSSWIERQTQDEESRRLYEQERLIAWIGEEIAAALEDSGLTRAEMARKLGTSRAYVTRVLQGSPNLTLRSLADLAWAAGSRISLSFEPLREGDFISCPVTVYSFPSVLVQDEEQASTPDARLSWNNHSLSA